MDAIFSAFVTLPSPVPQTHVVVDLARTEASSMEVLNFSVSTAVAIATFFLAAFTGALALQTWRVANQEDRHNRDSHSGIVVFDDLTKATLSLREPGETLEGEPRPTHLLLGIGGQLHNVGFGPALDVQLRVIFPVLEPIVHRIGTMAVGERRPLQTPASAHGCSPATNPVLPYIQVKYSDQPSSVELEYRTVYNETRVTSYRFGVSAISQPGTTSVRNGREERRTQRIFTYPLIDEVIALKPRPS